MKVYFKYDENDEVTYELLGEVTMDNEPTVVDALTSCDGWIKEAIRRDTRASSVCIVVYDDVMEELLCYEHDGRQLIIWGEDEIADEIR